MIKYILKDFYSAITNRMNIILLFIFPILIGILLGTLLSGEQIKHIPMAVIDEDNSEISRMIVSQFSENEIFNITSYPSSQEEMKYQLDNSKVRVGMIIPKDFSKDVTTLKSPSILMLYDGSHMSVASAAKSRANEILLTIKTGMLMKLIEGTLSVPADVAKNMAFSIDFNNRTLYNPTKSFKNFLNPGFSTAVVQTAIVLLSGALGASTLKISRRKKLIFIINRIVYYSIFGAISLMICILIQKNCFAIPFRGNLFDAFWLSLCLAFAASSFAVAISCWVPDKQFAILINAVLFIPSTVLVGYTWPVISMPKAYQTLASYMPFYHYADNIRNIFLKGYSFGNIKSDIIWLSCFALIFSLVSILGVIKPQVFRFHNRLKEGENIEVN